MYIGKYTLKLLSAWFIKWTWTHSPASLGSGQMSKLFSVLRKSVSICPAIAVPLCINICTVIGIHVNLGLPYDHFNQQVSLTSSLSQWRRTASVEDTCPKIHHSLRYWKSVFICCSKSDQIQIWILACILCPPSQNKTNFKIKNNIII